MLANQWMSRTLDEHRFDALTGDAGQPASGAALMLLDRDFRIRGLNSAYEAISLRRRDEILGETIFDVYPDSPDDPHADGSTRLATSVETVLEQRRTDIVPIVRYDITDPQDPDVFLPKLWTWSNISIEDPQEHAAVLHRVAEIKSLDEALSALSHHPANGAALTATEQVYALSGLAANIRAEQERAQAMAETIDQLKCALETRDIIGQAKGVLMERHGCDAAAAFDLLKKVSQRSNTPLRTVAERFVAMNHQST